MNYLFASQDMFHLLAVGTLWFWLFIALEVVLLFVFMYYEQGIVALVSLALFAISLCIFGDINLLVLMLNNPFWALATFVGYILLSVPWSIFRWAMLCRDKLEIYEEKKAAFLRNKNVPNAKFVPKEHRTEWKEYVVRTGRNIAEPPLARNHKSFIIRVMSLWLIDLIWWVLTDMYVRIWKNIYNHIVGSLQAISDNMFKKATAEDLNLE